MDCYLDLQSRVATVVNIFIFFDINVNIKNTEVGKGKRCAEVGCM